MQIWLRLSLATLLAVGTVGTSTSQACADLADRHNSSVQPRRWASYFGVPRPLAVWATPDPAQNALAHLLTLILRHLLGYEEVHTRRVNTTRDALERLSNISHQLMPEEFVMVPGLRVSSSNGEQAIASRIEKDQMTYIRAFSQLPLRLQSNLTRQALANPRCNISGSDWLRFFNFTSGDCNFLSYNEVKNRLTGQWDEPPNWCMEDNVCAAVLTPTEGRDDHALKSLRRFILIHRLKLAPVPLHNYKNLFNNRSLLILSDYDSSLHSDSTYLLIHKHLAIYAKRVAQTVYRFFELATNTDVGSKLSKKANEASNVVEEACKYLLDNEEQINRWLPPENSTIFIQYYLCQDDPNTDQIEKAMNIVQDVVRHKVSFIPRLLHAKLICDNGSESALLREMHKFRKDYLWPSLGAVVAPTANYKTQSSASDEETLLMLYESQGSPSAEFPVFLSTADRNSITTAAITWLKGKGYKKVTLKIENRSSEEIEQIKRALRAHHIHLQTYSKATTAQVLIVDADPDTIERLACEMPKDTKLLLLREWSSRLLWCGTGNERVQRMPVSIWTVSGSWPGGDLVTESPIGADSSLRQRLQFTLGDNWPPQVGPMTDAILTAAHALNDLYQHNSKFIYDLHGYNVTSRFLSDIVRKLKINGITQSLEYTNNQTLAEPVVFVTHWENGTSARLDTAMRVLARNGTLVLTVQEHHREATSNSLWVILYCILTVVTMALLCALLFKYWQVKYQKSIMSSQRPVCAQLAELELRRDELEVHEKIGEGVTGRVFLALWRGKHNAHVAVKTPVAGSIGAPQLLWEARVMAPLQHPNVVRLLGIVSGGTPPLVVLEYAIHGDLRRYLAETERAAGGLKHVSPVLLTRLAREAAAALDYLTSRNVIHRDIRASNCLINEHHTLKLADFGMARELPRNLTEGVSVNQYLCRRRAFFPVAWMAPESLKRGVFSPGSDIWSYGVLLIELVTLGARPYGDWSPHFVLYHVNNGGTPLLPLDASLDMCELAQRCWTRTASSRVTAAQALAFLERRPSALTPCAPVAPACLPPVSPSTTASSLEKEVTNTSNLINIS